MKNGRAFLKHRGDSNVQDGVNFYGCVHTSVTTMVWTPPHCGHMGVTCLFFRYLFDCAKAIYRSGCCWNSKCLQCNNATKNILPKGYKLIIINLINLYPFIIILLL